MKQDLRAAYGVLPESEIRRVLEQTMAKIQADDASLYLESETSELTRFANNGITQNIATTGHRLHITVAFGKQRGSTLAATLLPADVESAIRRAEAIARRSPADPEYLPTLGAGQRYLPMPPLDPATLGANADERARRVALIVERAKRAGLVAAGIVNVEVGTNGMLTKNGCYTYAPYAYAKMGCTVTGKTSSGWAQNASLHLADLDANALVEEAIRQVKLSANPRPLPPGKYTTILMPAALGGILYPVLNGLSARETDEGLTYLTGKIGKQLAGTNVTLRSDPQNTRIGGFPFDGDGVPIHPRTWIDKGVIGQTLIYDRFTAQKHKVDPIPAVTTGIGLIMDGSDKSPEDLIKNVEKGVLVNHFWYIRDIKPDETLLTGMTRDAVFYIENGKIAYGLKQMRWNDSTLRVLSHIREMSRPFPAQDAESPLALLPAVTVEDFNFVSASDF